MRIRAILAVIIIVAGLYAGFKTYKMITDYVDVRAKVIEEIIK